MPMVAGSVTVVEDHEGLRMAVARFLQASGHEVSMFASAEALLASEDRNRATCLVLDIRLPGLSGFELRERLKAEGSAAPVIYVTAYDDPLARQRAEGEGSAFLLKPVEGAVLLAAIARALEACSREPHQGADQNV